MSTKNNPLLASYHNNVAIRGGLLCENKRAMEHYRNGIRLEFSASQPDNLSIAYCYETVGHILNYTYNQYNKALNYYQNALERMLEHLSFAHPDTIARYGSMADAYEEQNKLDEALYMVSISVDRMLTSVECNPRNLISTYKHMTRIYRKLKKFAEASVMLNKCHEIEAAYPSSENFNLENVNIDALVAKIFRSDNNS